MKRRAIRLAGTLAATGLALGLTLGATGTARADVTPPTYGWSEIFNPYLTAQHITLCLDDPEGSRAANTLLQLYHCHGYASNGAPQRWTFLPTFDSKTGDPLTGSGHILYKVVNTVTGLCLGAPNITAGTITRLVDCNSGPGNWWVLISSPASPTGPDFQLQLWNPWIAPSLDCAAASNFTDNNGTRLVIEPCSPTDTRQLFRLG
jgi:hypothetical protein